MSQVNDKSPLLFLFGGPRNSLLMEIKFKTLLQCAKAKTQQVNGWLMGFSDKSMSNPDKLHVPSGE